MYEILTGCLTGGGTSRPIPGSKRGQIANSMLSVYPPTGYLPPGSFGTAGFEDAARDYAHYVKASRPAEPGAEVIIPGEPENRTRAERLTSGTPVQTETWAASPPVRVPDLADALRRF